MQQITETYNDMSSLLSIEKNNTESNEMEATVNKAYLEGKLSSGLSIW